VGHLAALAPLRFPTFVTEFDCLSNELVDLNLINRIQAQGGRPHQGIREYATLLHYSLFNLDPDFKVLHSEGQIRDKSLK
jgi:hypothetical protein